MPRIARHQSLTSAIGAVAIVALMGAGAGDALAADWQPTERIVLVSQSSPGTGNDLMLREIADIWTKNKMVPVLVGVENVTGARSENARRHVAEKNKGNTHMLYAFTPASMNQSIIGGSPFTYKSFTPIANIMVDPSVLVVSASSPYKTLKDLIEAAKKAPKTILQGGGPYGNSASMEGHMLEDAAGVQFSYTPFKGGGEAVTALLGGHIHFLLENPAEVEANVAAGKLRILAASEKLPQHPDVPTFKQAGYDAQLIPQFRAVVAPPGIAPEVAAYYIALLDRTRQTPQWKEYVKKNALLESFVTGDNLTKLFDKQDPAFRKMDERMGLLKK